MRTRVISAIVMITAVYFVLMHLPWYAFAGVVLLLGWISLHEYQSMLDANRSWSHKLYLMLFMTPFLLAPASDIIGFSWNVNTWLFVTFFAVCFLHLRNPVPLEKSTY